MTSILDNKLVRNYFGCTHGADCNCTAENVLRAMQERIKHGDRYIHIQNDGTMAEQSPGWDSENESFHPTSLRLPSRFQPSSGKKECCEYHEGKWVNDTTSGKFISWCGKDKTQSPPTPKCNGNNSETCPVHKPDEPEKCENAGIPGHHAVKDCPCGCCISQLAIEAKIKEIISDHPYLYEPKLRELVALARRSER